MRRDIPDQKFVLVPRSNCNGKEQCEHWNVLVGCATPVSARGGDPAQQEDSQLTLPDGTKLQVLGGTFTTEKFIEGFDAETPLTGKIELNCETPNGPKTYQGTFAVKGTTWG